MRGSGNNGGGSDGQDGTILWIDDTDRVAADGGHRRGTGRASADDALTGVKHGDRIVAGATDARIVGGEFFEEGLAASPQPLA